ncbi:MAG TPA: hypothetical protein DCE43_16055 [Planctomycetaceae bacterium]|nr:hypothetical protein [Planctomycetaceae bacterium]
MIYKGPVSVDRLLADVALMTDSLDVDPAVAFPGRWFLRPHGLGNVVVRVADRLVRRGHLAAATSYAELAADLAKRNGNPFDLTHKTASALVDLGNAWDNQRRFSEAATAYRMAHRVDPTDAAAVTNLGNVTLSLGDEQSAARHYRHAIDLDPNQLQARMNLGSICLQEQRIFEAVQHLKAAVRINPGFPQAHNLLGRALLKQGRTSGARLHFQRAIELDPDYQDARDSLRDMDGPGVEGGGS